MQETDQLKLELVDIGKEMKNTDDQTSSLRDKITHEEKQLEQLTQAADTAKVITLPCLPPPSLLVCSSPPTMKCRYGACM